MDQMLYGGGGLDDLADPSRSLSPGAASFMSAVQQPQRVNTASFSDAQFDRFVGDGSEVDASHYQGPAAPYDWQSFQSDALGLGNSFAPHYMPHQTHAGPTHIDPGFSMSYTQDTSNSFIARPTIALQGRSVTPPTSAGYVQSTGLPANMIGPAHQPNTGFITNATTLPGYTYQRLSDRGHRPSPEASNFDEEVHALIKLMEGGKIRVWQQKRFYHVFITGKTFYGTIEGFLTEHPNAEATVFRKYAVYMVQKQREAEQLASAVDPTEAAVPRAPFEDQRVGHADIDRLAEYDTTRGISNFTPSIPQSANFATPPGVKGDDCLLRETVAKMQAGQINVNLNILVKVAIPGTSTTFQGTAAKLLSTHPQMRKTFYEHRASIDIKNKRAFTFDHREMRSTEMKDDEKRLKNSASYSMEIDDVEAALKRLRRPHRRVAPKYDDVDLVEIDIKACKDRLFHAMCSLPADATDWQEKQWTDWEKEAHDLEIVEAKCWMIMKAVIEVHTKGICLVKEDWGVKSRDDNTMTASERFEVILKHLLYYKALCSDVMNDSHLVRFVSAPHATLAKKQRYKLSNDARSKTYKAQMRSGGGGRGTPTQSRDSQDANGGAKEGSSTAITPRSAPHLTSVRTSSNRMTTRSKQREDDRIHHEFSTAEGEDDRTNHDSRDEVMVDPPTDALAAGDVQPEADSTLSHITVAKYTKKSGKKRQHLEVEETEEVDSMQVEQPLAVRRSRRSAAKRQRQT